MNQKSFAAEVKREHIMGCENIGIPVEEFIAISVEAMKDAGVKEF